MAIQFFGLNRGGRVEDVATGTSTTSKKLELAVDDTVGLTRKEVLQLLDTLKQYLLNQRSTPFAQ
jgi:hypothetical protein